MAFTDDPQHPVEYLTGPPVVAWEDPRYLRGSPAFQLEDGELDHPSPDANIDKRLALHENLLNQIVTQQWRTSEDLATLLRILRRVEQLLRAVEKWTRRI